MRVLWTLTALLLVGGLVAVPVVGSGGSERAASQLVAAARDTTSQATSFSYASTSTSTVGGAVGFSITTEGSFDAESMRSSLHMTSAGVAAFDARFVTEGSVIYAQVPADRQPLASGKPWVSFDGGPAALEGLGGIGQGGLDALLPGASGTSKPVGSEEVRGVSTTHHRLNVDADALIKTILERQAAQVPGGVAPGLDQLGRDVTIDVAPVDIWLDDDDRVRRVELAMDISAGGISVKVTVRHELFDFGTPVRIEIPEAAAVHPVGDLSTLMDLMRAGG